MGRKTLIINPGSSSKKYALYEGMQLRAMGKFELSGKVSIVLPSGKEEHTLSADEYKRAVDFFANTLGFALNDIETIGIRVVAPGSYFQENRIFDKGYLKKLKEAMEIAPLHLSQTLEEYHHIRKNASRVPVIAISDSAFHKTISDHNQLYSIDYNDAIKYDIKRYGYHGISIQSVVRQLKNLKLNETDKIIICHLGSGSSITALKKLKSIETSMGFTPLSGVTMATRAGDIDPGLFVYLWKKKRWNSDTALNYFNTKCGLQGLTGTTSDMRTILAEAKKNNKKSSMAFNKYIHEIKKMIGAYVATLGGVDLLIFTGGIGENSSEVRSAICTQMGKLGIIINQQLNKFDKHKIGFINDDTSIVKMIVVPTEEEREMFHQILNLKKAYEI